MSEIDRSAMINELRTELAVCVAVVENSKHPNHALVAGVVDEMYAILAKLQQDIEARGSE